MFHKQWETNNAWKIQQWCGFLVWIHRGYLFLSLKIFSSVYGGFGNLFLQGKSDENKHFKYHTFSVYHANACSLIRKLWDFPLLHCGFLYYLFREGKVLLSYWSHLESCKGLKQLICPSHTSFSDIYACCHLIWQA